MNRDYYSSGAYMQFTELQPAHAYHQQFDLTQVSSAGPSSYEMTPGGAGDANVDLVSLQPTQGPLHHHDLRKRRASHYTDGYESMSGCETPVAGSSGASSVSTPSARKRKSSSYGTASTFDDDEQEKRSTRTLPDKKQNHSEIEKRRRDKMNTYIAELSAMVPMCGAMARKLDKLSVLRMAVQHMRVVRGALSACPLAARPHAALLPPRDLNALVLHAARHAALLVVGCDRGRLLYVSASVTDMLLYQQSELLGQSLFDILHPKDVAKVKEQLSSSDLSPRERLIDAKTMLPVKAGVGAGAPRLCPGARRSFFCRIKCKASVPQPGNVKEEGETSGGRLRKKNEKKYCVVQCTGYLKPWVPAEMMEGGADMAQGMGDGGDDEAGNMSCLVAVGRVLHYVPAAAPYPPPPAAATAPAPAPPTRRLQFVSRHAIDGKYTFVDQRVTPVLGYLPQELLGTSLYEYVTGGGEGEGGGGGGGAGGGDAALGGVARAHQAALARRKPLYTPPYCARRKDGSHVRLQTLFKPFWNPWTKDIESLVAQNTLISEGQTPAAEEDTLTFVDLEQQKGDAEVQRLIDAQVESHKIGSAIAEEALRRASNDLSSPELPSDLFDNVEFINTEAVLDNMACGDISLHVRNNVPLSAAGGSSPGARVEEEGEGEGDGSPSVSPPLALDGNGEAAMAVIMSLLEADAGLGGPVNFSGLPWPLP